MVSALGRVWEVIVDGFRMTTVSGADRHDGVTVRADSIAEHPAAERPAAASGVTAVRPPDAPRSLDRIFPQQTDVPRARRMQDTWRAFSDQMGPVVSGVLDGGGLPSEIAHVLTEMVQNCFRTSGVTLTSYELRRLVIELLELHSRARHASPRPLPEESDSVVSFTAEPVTPAPGVDDPPGAAVPEAVCEAPPSTLASLPIRESIAPQAAPVVAATASSPQNPINRLWADRSIDAILIYGPGAVFVERNGVVELSTEVFRDGAHLEEIAAELVRRSTSAGHPVSAIADFQMDDGAAGTVIFPPAAARGPVIVVRRDDAATMTFERLVARGAMCQAMANLLRLAVQCRLNILISGPASATTGWLGAVGRACDASARIVSVAREQDLSWTTPGRVELVVPPLAESGVGYPSLIAAGARLRPDLLLLKDVDADDMPALFDRLSHGDRGIVASMTPGPTARRLEPSFDLCLRLDRDADGVCRALVLQDAAGVPVFIHDQGQFVRRTGDPTFGAAVRAAGYGGALLAILN